jgi:pectate lyase
MIFSIFTRLTPFSIILLILTFTLNAQQLAFPTAEGYGKFAKGGRGGKVYEITTINGSGPGSFGEAINAGGPRTVIFRISGTIEGSYKISNGQITIAGQTAPGDGICIKGHVTIASDDIIMRYIRIRNTASNDALNGSGNNVIIDHVSCSWSNDEVLSVYGGSHVTIQYCLISEACQRQNSHRFGGIWGNNFGTYHHNCFAHNDNRTPRWTNQGSGKNDYRNNVVYNWGYGSCYGGAGKDEINMIANYYKPGPATEADVKSRIARLHGGTWYLSDNVMEGSPEVTADNLKGVSMEGGKKTNAPWDAMPIKQETAEAAYETFLKHGGCSFPKWDSIDARIIEEIRTGTAKFGRNGIIDHPKDVGGWPELKSLPAPVDGDHDGIPDDWEKKNGLDPNDATDGAKTGKDGYTNLENYINSLVYDKPVSNKKNADNKYYTSGNYLVTANSLSQIKVLVPERSNYKLEIYDMTGRRIALIFSGVMEAGEYFNDIRSLRLNSGFYIYNLKTANGSVTGKLFLGD